MAYLADCSPQLCKREGVLAIICLLLEEIPFLPCNLILDLTQPCK